MLVFCVYILFIQYTSLTGTKYAVPPVQVWDVLIVLIVVCGLVTVVEAVTQENDNVVLPLYACILLLLFVVFYSV